MLFAKRILMVIACLCLCQYAIAQTPKTPEADSGISRIVHEFTFMEPDNLNDIPKYWVRFPDLTEPDPVFPRYTEGFFDRDIGHLAPPSFYLEHKGHCVAFRYVGPAARIKPGDYLVTGWVKPDRIQHARATISAYYLNWEGEYIEGTQRYGRLIGSQGDRDEWQKVEIHLPNAPKNGHFIGVTCWVVQQDVWMEGMMPHRYISLRDIYGGAWFDDITIYGLPRAVLKSTHPGNIVEKPAPIQLLATVSDEEVEGLTAELVVHNQDGDVVYTVKVKPRTYEEEEADRFILRGLEPGLYVADLNVFSLGKSILRRTLSLAVLGKPHRPPNTAVRQMGVSITSVNPQQTEDELAILKALQVGAAKLPLWTGQPTEPGYEMYRDNLHHVLDEMIKTRITVTGVLAGPPLPMVKTVGAHARSLLDILSEDPTGWRKYLISMVAPYASIFHSWQIGRDGDIQFINDERAPAAINAVRSEMQSMITKPNLASVGTAADTPSVDKLPVQNLSIVLPKDIRPTYIPNHLKPYKQLQYPHLWVTIPPPDLKGLDVEFALADWALRIIETRWSNPSTIFVPQPWQTRKTANHYVTEPTRCYIVYRTIIDMIGDANPTSHLNIGSTGKALAFDDGQRSILVMWDPAAPAEGKEYTIQLGEATEAIDIRGRSIPLERASDGRHIVKLTPSPLFVTGMEQWLIAFRAGLELTPAHLNFSYEKKRHMLNVTNTYSKPMSGEIELTPPSNWEVEPTRIKFSLYPGETYSFPIDIRHPYNETAGKKAIIASINILSGQKYKMLVPLEFELGLSDVHVWGYAVTEKNRLIVKHGVTNRSNSVLSFRTFATYPGRSRQYRVINELLPGQTLTIDYRFSNVSDASGKRIRLGLQEVNGPRMHNLEVVVP